MRCWVSPGIAVSLKRSQSAYDFGPAAEAARVVAKMVLEKGLSVPRSFININVPAGTPKGLRVTTQAKRNHVTKIDSRTDPRGNAYYWIEEALDEYHPDSGRTDYEAVMDGYTSVTPLQPDMTAYRLARTSGETLEKGVKRPLLAFVAAALFWPPVAGQVARTPSARLVSAPRLDLPAEIDSSSPAAWALIDGVQRLFVIASWGGIPVRLVGTDLDSLGSEGPVQFSSHPGHGVWMESIVPDDQGVWYGYYHHERSADQCGRPDRQLPRIGALRSVDHGRTWENLGIVIDAPPGSEACDSQNRFVLGGVGDAAVVLDHESKDLYLYFSQYSRDPAVQGVAVARLAWADRDNPAGKVTIWNEGAWLPAAEALVLTSDGSRVYEYPSGTPLVRASRPFHDRSAASDVFWGASIHWNTYLEQYVMLLNRAKDDQFGQDGIYVSYSPTLADPGRWTEPTKILSGGEWYPQVIGGETGSGTDRLAGRRARFFMTGRSDRLIEFER